MDIDKMLFTMLEQTHELIKENKDLTCKAMEENEKWRNHDRKKFKGMVVVAVVGLLLLGFIIYCMYFTPIKYNGSNNYNTNSEIGVEK